MRRLFLLLTSFALALSPAVAMAAPEIGKPAPDFTGSAADGTSVKLSEYKGSVVVLEWHNPGCPFVKKHYGSGNMQKLQAYAHGKSVVWLTVNSGAPGREGNMTPQQAKEYVAGSGLTVAHYILDPAGDIGRLYGATATPHMFVIDAGGNLAYMGAIDDKPTADPKDIAGANNYVRAAIDGLLSGAPLAVTSTQPYGCSVKYAH